MTTLVIHAPEYQHYREDAKSFKDTFDTGIGQAYALYDTIYRKIHPGCRVVLLCKDRKRRAEGQLVRLEPATKDGRPWITKNGIQRYDVYVEGFKVVPYRPETLNHCGVAII